MNGPQGKETLRLIDLANASWFTRPEGSSIWISAYRVFRVPKESLKGGTKVIDLDQLRAVFLFGSVRYLDAARARFDILTDDKFGFDASKIQERETPEGMYLLFVLPYGVDGASGNEPLTRERISTTAGLLAALDGRNVVYERVFDNIFEMQDAKTTTAFSRVTDNPMSFAAPDLSEVGLGRLTEIDRAIAGLGDLDRNRIRLSLRWFESALYDAGTDAFLKYWIALETLGMPNTTDIRPLNEAIARTYQISYAEARDGFCVGRLFGLRSRLVHDGQIVPLHYLVLRYMEALYSDVLFERLRLPIDGRAGELLHDASARSIVEAL